jgi:hypothetical protein
MIDQETPGIRILGAGYLGHKFAPFILLSCRILTEENAGTAEIINSNHEGHEEPRKNSTFTKKSTIYGLAIENRKSSVKSLLFSFSGLFLVRFFQLFIQKQQKFSLTVT